MEVDLDEDLDIEEIFSVLQQEEESSTRLPPVPIPLLTKRKREDDDDSSNKAAKTTLSVEDSEAGDRDLPEEGKDFEVLDEFQTSTEKILGAVDQPAAAKNGAESDVGAATGEIKFSKANVSTRHEVVLPAGFDKSVYIPMKSYSAPPMTEWARQYPFTLDPFQEYSIYCIQRSESVLVAAHTSAGKTVVAEYAIAQALKSKQRVIYTSPIKALSNQKYRELLEEFGDVGLMTGDVTINPRASCLVMTTEILRSMLYRGSEVLREISWVVYDEIHYMRDKDRGVVWEETLILLPPSVHFVFLSATIPNAKQFAQWICKIQNQPCHVVYTDFRPTPLQHYVFPAGASGIHLVVDEKGTFREDNFQKAMAVLASSDDDLRKGKSKKKGPTGRDEKNDIYKIVKMIMQRNYHPVIVFSFSKKECEALALDMSKLDFNNDDEKELVNDVFTNAVSQLGDDDQNLPQITNILPLLRRGIGIHHSGLLPILKETIEILFQEGLLKVLFATETFSIGLNMPAKTVVFTKIEKFDGKELRHLSGGEYIQMSGRAGRRGLDDKGIVIMMVDQKIDSEKAKGMVKGEANALYSAFRLGYNMILNLSRVEGISPEFLIRQSFRQFQNNTKLPQLMRQCAEYEEMYAQHSVPDEDLIRSYYEARYTYELYVKDFRDVISHPNYAIPFMGPGRLVQIINNGVDFRWGVVLNWNKRKGAAAANSVDHKDPRASSTNYILDVAILIDPITKGEKLDYLRPPAPDAEATSELTVVPAVLSTVAAISSIRITLRDTNLKDADARKCLQKMLLETKRRLMEKCKEVPCLDPVKDMDIRDVKFAELLKKLDKYGKMIKKHSLNADPLRLKSLYERYQAKIGLSERIKLIRKQIRDAEAIQQMEELKCRKRILRRLEFTDERDVVQMKGRVACEISSGDPLLLTELLFNGVYSDLTAQQCVALLAVFTFQERLGHNAPKPKLSEELSKPLQILQETAKKIAMISKEAQLDFDEREYLESFKPDLMEVAFAWANGAKFGQICKMTDVFEGNLVRNFRLLEELLKQMSAAVRVMGNQDLEIKFTQGVSSIKRDIIFANSLYL